MAKPGDTDAAARRHKLRTWLQSLRSIPAVTVFEWSAAAVIVVCATVGFTVGMAGILAENVSTAPQQSCANWFGSTAADSTCVP